jgi:hypothetical protein
MGWRGGIGRGKIGECMTAGGVRKMTEDDGKMQGVVEKGGMVATQMRGRRTGERETGGVRTDGMKSMRNTGTQDGQRRSLRGTWMAMGWPLERAEWMRKRQRSVRQLRGSCWRRVHGEGRQKHGRKQHSDMFASE